MDPDEPTTAPPPGYNANAPSNAPPSYTHDFPEEFTINSKRVPAFVNVAQLKTHLRLLGAFHDLRSMVEAGEDVRIPAQVRDFEADQRWGWFVNLAVERYVGSFSYRKNDNWEIRFQRWLVELIQHPSPDHLSLGIWIEQCIPPLDVVMVWHSYLLNPG